MYSIEVKRALTDQDYTEWDELWKKSANPKVYNSIYWFKTCSSIFRGKYLVIYIYKDGMLNSIIPIKSLWNMIYISPGGRYLDKSANLFSDNSSEAIEFIVREFFNNKWFIFTEVPENELQFYSDSDFCRTCSVNPFADIDDGLSSISKRTRKKLDKIIAENENCFSLRIYKDDIKDEIHTMFDIESNSNKIDRKRALFTDEKIRQFFTDISRFPGTRLFVLYYKDIPIAHTFDFINGYYLTGCHTAYLEDHKALMPGKMLTYFVMNYCKNNGIKMYDFSRGECDKKAQFSKKKSDNCCLYYGNALFICGVKMYYKTNSWLKLIKKELRHLKLIK